jgi:hypothetical protein
MAIDEKQNKPHDLHIDRVESLVKRASAGDESAVPEIRKLLDQAPQFVKVLGGDLAHNAQLMLVQAIAGKHISMREAMHRRMAQLRAELSGPDPDPLERLLVERVVVCWLHTYHADLLYAASKANEVTLIYSEFLQRQQDRAQRRYLAAIKSLAAVRRLLLPIRLDVTLAGTHENNSDASVESLVSPQNHDVRKRAAGRVDAMGRPGMVAGANGCAAR